MKLILVNSGSVRLLTLVSLVILTGCDRPPRPAESQLEGIATVDGRPVPAWKLEAELERTSRRGHSPDPRRAFASLIDRERLVARALQLGLDRDPGVQRAWEMALIAKLKEQELEPLLRAATSDIPDERFTNPPGSTSLNPERLRLAILRQGIHPRLGPDKLQRLEQRLEEARARAATLPPHTLGFGPLALEYSDDDTTRARGGDLGWMEPDPSKYHLDPQVLAAGFALIHPGQMSPIVQSQDGFYLVRLVDRQRLDPQPAAADDSSRALVQHQQQLARRQSIEAAFLEEIRRHIPVTTNRAELDPLITRPSINWPSSSPMPLQ